MTASSIQMTAGSGTHGRTHTRSYSGTTKHTEYVMVDDADLPTYTVIAANISVATSADHILQIMAGSANNVRIDRVLLRQRTLASATTQLLVDVFRLSTAGTGGSTVTARAHDPADGAYSGACMTLPSSKGTEGVQPFRLYASMASAQPITSLNEDEWTPYGLHEKPLIIAAGTSNGFAFKVNSGIASATVDLLVTFRECDY